MIPESIIEPGSLKAVLAERTTDTNSHLLQYATVIALPTAQNIPLHALVASKAFSILGLAEYTPVNYLNHKLKGIDKKNYDREIEKIEKIAGEDCFVTATRVLCNDVAEFPFEFCEHDLAQRNITAVSRLGENNEFLIAYNSSYSEPREFFVKVNYSNLQHVVKLNVLYGYDVCGTIPVNSYRLNDENISYIKLYLKPLHLVLLRN